MKKIIILTSSGFKTFQLQKDLLSLLPKPAPKIKVAHIPTASKVSEDTGFVDRERKVLKDLGFQVEEIDIERENEKSLMKKLSGKDIIYVQGGNTFYLLKQVSQSGFDKVVKSLIEKGVIYIGVSAGSYIACPTIEMAVWKHTDRSHYGLRSLKAMNLVPFLVSVHYNREKYRLGLKEGIARAKYPVRILTDDQAFLIINGKVKLIGSGEEIKVTFPD